MKPSSTNDNYIPQTITLGCIVLFSLAVRSTTLSCGADGFTAFCVFLICSVVFFLLFLAVQSLLEELFGHIFRSQEREDFELYLLFVLYSISFPYTMVYCNQNETISCLSSDDVQMTSFIPDHKCKGITFLNLSQTLCEINNWKNFWLHF